MRILQPQKRKKNPGTQRAHSRKAPPGQGQLTEKAALETSLDYTRTSMDNKKMQPSVPPGIENPGAGGLLTVSFARRCVSLFPESSSALTGHNHLRRSNEATVLRGRSRKRAKGALPTATYLPTRRSLKRIFLEQTSYQHFCLPRIIVSHSAHNLLAPYRTRNRRMAHRRPDPVQEHMLDIQRS